MKVVYNKLIRDKIPENIRKVGEESKTIKLSESGFRKELLKKIVEEALGVSKARNKNELLDELADLEIVLDEAMKKFKISSADLKAAKRKNYARKGGFKKRLYFIWSSDGGYKSNESDQSNKIA